MSRLFDVKDVDRRFYREKLQHFLPDRIIDVHAHVWRRDFRKAPPTGRAVTWPLRVAEQDPVEDLIETYELLFPGKSVQPLMFSFVESHEDDFEAANAYVSRAAQEHGFAALVFASPQWSAQRLEQEIRRGGFLGAKVYLTLSPAGLPVDQIRIFDFLPHHQLEVLNEHGWIVMLHIPRSARLRDPVNLADMLEIDRRYPHAKVIIAHAGRAYCPEDVGDAFAALQETQHLLFDISANTNAAVFEPLIRTVGPRRILFGSDLPITRMRMHRICEKGNYVNLVPKGLYGNVSDDQHMREVAGEQAEATFLLPLRGDRRLPPGRRGHGTDPGGHCGRVPRQCRPAARRGCRSKGGPVKDYGSFELHLLDYLAFGAYFAGLCLIGYWFGRKKQQDSADYFLAGRTLPWYVVGSSFIASNISSEHFIGMIGAAFIYGIAPAMFEWANVATFTLLIWFFIPFLLAARVFSTPEFLEKRFNPTIRQFFAYVTVISNVVAFLAAVLYGGGLGPE